MSSRLSSNYTTGPNCTVTIAVMGPTGAGKTTFVNLLSGSNMVVGHSLKSCTSEVQAAPPFLMDGKAVTLVDTPGLDDTVKSEAEVLQLIISFLAVTFEQGRRLNGVIYFHRISDDRVGGITRKNFRVFRKLCGDDTLKNVVIVTTMWSQVDPETGRKRERELSTNEMFFKPALENGARMVRHDNTIESGRCILRQILDSAPKPLTIQREIVQERKIFVETDVGKDLRGEFERKAAEHRAELDGAQRELKELMAEKEEKHIVELRAIREEMGQKDAIHQAEVQELRKTIEEIQGQLAKVESESRALRKEHAMYDDRLVAMTQAMKDKENELRESKGNSLKPLKSDEAVHRNPSGNGTGSTDHAAHSHTRHSTQSRPSSTSSPSNEPSASTEAERELPKNSNGTIAAIGTVVAVFALFARMLI